MSTTPLIACTPGDPAGIGPEVVLRAGAEMGEAASAVVVLGDPRHLEELASELGVTAPRPVESTREACRNVEAGESGPWALECGRLEPGLRPGKARPEDGALALAAIEHGARLALDGDVDALVTAPVSKAVIAAHEPAFVGHTELLAERAGVRHPVMVFVGPSPAVALLTTHLPLATAVAAVRRQRIAAMLQRLDSGWRRWFAQRPQIAVAALNPHAGESGRLGDDDEREVLPGIADARAAGVEATGPHPADSVFRRAGVDVVLALYHDQGTVMAKRAPGVSVNLTLGLPYPRTSPDHGVAYDIAGRGIADPTAMRAALEMALELGGR